MQRFKQYRWGEEEATLIELKEQQIRRLQGELQAEKRRADNAIKIIDTFKQINSHQEDYVDQRQKRIQAQRLVQILKTKNKKLQEAIQCYLEKLKNK